MSAELTAIVRAGLTWAKVGGEAIEFASDLLDQREVQKMELYLADLSSLERSVPARIASSGEAALVNDVLGKTATAAKGLEEVRVARMKPVLAEQRSIQAIFAPVQDALAKLQKRCKDALTTWQAAERERVRLEREAAERAAIEAARRQAEAEQRAVEAVTPQAQAAAVDAAKTEAAAVDAALAAVPRDPPRGIKSEHGTTSMREEWTVEVVDEQQVPRQYLDVNVSRLRAAVRSGTREIPGCSITLRPVVTVRTR